MVLEFIRGKHVHKVSFEQAPSGPIEEEQPAALGASSTSHAASTNASSSNSGTPGQAGESRKLKTELKKLLKRAAVSFRDLNISVHDASTNSLVHLNDSHAAAPHTHTACCGHVTGASVLTAGRQRVEVEQKKLAIIMVSCSQQARGDSRALGVASGGTLVLPGHNITASTCRVAFENHCIGLR